MIYILEKARHSNMRWQWVQDYFSDFVGGTIVTIELLGIAIFAGMALAIPIGLVQVQGPRILARVAQGYCTIIRGTPVLIQIWLIYYGLGSLFPQFAGLQQSWLWPLLRDAFPYAALAFTLSVAGYAGEIMRGGFRSVPAGELEAGVAHGMSRMQLLRRIWLPRALQNTLPALGGEFILTLKSTPLAATITVYDVFGVGTLVRQETYLVYEPLLVVAAIYICLTGVIVGAMRWLESRSP